MRAPSPRPPARRVRAATSLALALALASATFARAGAGNLTALRGPARTTLQAYLSAIAAGKYGAAYALLSRDGRHYFGNGANYASIFTTDRLKLEHSTIGGATVTNRGIIATVVETTQYFDPTTQSLEEAQGNVLYGLVKEGAVYRIKDPYHPWRAIPVEGAHAANDKLTVTIRKVSFFTGRVELVVAFENLGDVPVTILPNRTIVRDDRGNVLHCLIDPAAPFTDRQIRLGLRLAANARYTGALAFGTVDRYRPRSLQLSVGPMLRDEADQPFSIDLSAVAIPR